MHAHAFLRWFEPAAGAVLMFPALLDMFLTVLYARAGAGYISDRVATYTWIVTRAFSKAFRRRRDIVFSLAGSFIVVMLVATWAGILTVGSALIMHQHFGTGVKSGSGSTNTDFLNALFAGGGSMSLVGSSNYSAETVPFRVVFLINSLIGMSTMSLALTYIMQIYSALQSRNTFGLTIHRSTARTGNAAALLQGVAVDNQFSNGYTNLGQIADGLAEIREAHDFYPVLFYFRFPEPFYSTSRTTLIALDAVSLLKCAIPDGENGWIKRAASVTELWESGTSVLRMLRQSFVPGEMPESDPEATSQERAQWTERYRRAVAGLREAGVHTVADHQHQGAEQYIGLRKRWNHHIVHLAHYMDWHMNEIDVAIGGNNPADQQD